MLAARWFILCLLTLGACKSQEKGTEAAMQPSEQNQELTLILSDNYGGSEYVDFQVIRDMKTLRQFFIQVNKTRKPGLPVPDIDFSKEIVLLHCPGKMGDVSASGLYIMEDSSEKIVLATKEGKVKQKIGNEALIMPFSLYKLPLTEKEIVFKKE
ncbi:MAG: hypothetical protein KJO20_09095 [Eudoraea sp.]|nr:hypothetical protein [Eudoraea sp.]NNK29777.1 hypothetical protein [Flavobacteriaceae bacterium]